MGNDQTSGSQGHIQTTSLETVRSVSSQVRTTGWVVGVAGRDGCMHGGLVCGLERRVKCGD